MTSATNYLSRFPRILVADCAVGEFVAEAFSSALGLPAVAFKTSDKLLAALKPGQDALVLCEYTTPPHCFDLLRSVKELDPSIPFVFVTATGSPSIQEKARLGKAQGLIAKPFKPETLAALRKYMSAWQHGEETPFFDGSPWDQPAVLQEPADALRQKEFIVVIAVGEEHELSEVFTGFITRAVPDVPVRIVTTESTNFSVVQALPELRDACLFVTMINNLYEGAASTSWFEPRVEFIRQLRARTKAIIFVASGMWGPDVRDKFLQAGASVVEQAPFKGAVLEEAARDAYRLWRSNCQLSKSMPK